MLVYNRPRRAPVHGIGFAINTGRGNRSMVTRLAILDDYQNVALDSADWGALPPEVEITVFNEYIEGEKAVAEALSDFDIVVAMRERTPFRRP